MALSVLCPYSFITVFYIRPVNFENAFDVAGDDWSNIAGISPPRTTIQMVLKTISVYIP